MSQAAGRQARLGEIIVLESRHVSGLSLVILVHCPDVDKDCSRSERQTMLTDVGTVKQFLFF